MFFPDSNSHVANMGPTWVLSVPGGPYVGPMRTNLNNLRLFSIKRYKIRIYIFFQNINHVKGNADGLMQTYVTPLLMHCSYASSASIHRCTVLTLHVSVTCIHGTKHDWQEKFYSLHCSPLPLMVTGEFPTQRPVTRSFDIFFDLRLNKWLS